MFDKPDPLCRPANYGNLFHRLDNVTKSATPFHFVLRNNITVKISVFRYNIQFARPPVLVDDTVWLLHSLLVKLTHINPLTVRRLRDTLGTFSQPGV